MERRTLVTFLVCFRYFVTKNSVTCALLLLLTRDSLPFDQFTRVTNRSESRTPLKGPTSRAPQFRFGPFYVTGGPEFLFSTLNFSTTTPSSFLVSTTSNVLFYGLSSFPESLSLLVVLQLSKRECMNRLTNSRVRALFCCVLFLMSILRAHPGPYHGKGGRSELLER